MTNSKVVYVPSPEVTVTEINEGERMPVRPADLFQPLTVDRIVPGCKGGTYRCNNIRPACGACNSETGGALAGRKS